MATIGQQLTAPEAGWKRYDDTDPLIEYENGQYGWVADTSWSDNWMGTQHYEHPTGNEKIKFNFTGTKLRILSPINTTCTNKARITIDGLEYFFSQYATSWVNGALCFEITDLTNREHSVIINVDLSSPPVNGTRVLGLDAIDIDEDGELLSYNPDIDVPTNPTDHELHILLEIGEQIQLIGNTLPEKIGDPNLEWKSTLPHIATVDATGKVTASDEGVTSIQVKTIDGTWTDYALVEVVAKEEDDEYRLAILLKVGESCLLKFAEFGEVIWQSGDPVVATVDPSDTPITRVTAHAKGVSLITVQSVDGSKRDQIYVTVIE